MGGHSNILSQEIDVYAFAITCVEVLDNGVMPWQHQDDDAVVRFVLREYDLLVCLFQRLNDLFTEENQRPRLPNTRVSSPELTALINACWDRDTSKRPTFKDIAATLQRLRGVGVEIESPRPPQSELWGETAHQRPSPDMRPIPLPGAGTSSSKSLGQRTYVFYSHQTKISASSPGEVHQVQKAHSPLLWGLRMYPLPPESQAVFLAFKHNLRLRGSLSVSSTPPPTIAASHHPSSILLSLVYRISSRELGPSMMGMTRRRQRTISLRKSGMRGVTDCC